MAYEQPLMKVGNLPPNDASFATVQFLACKVIPYANGSKGAGLGLPSAGGSILGIVQNKPIQDEAGEVMSQGISKATASAAFAVGVKLAADAAGKLRTAASGEQIVATALEASTATGDIVAVYLLNEGKA